MIALLTTAEVGNNARAFLAAVSVAPDVLRPDDRVLVMVAEGLQPGLPDQITDELLARAGTWARITLDGRAPGDAPQVADWRTAYRAFHQISNRAIPLRRESWPPALGPGERSPGHATNGCVERR